MTEQSRVVMASLIGTVVGGLVGYLYLTENGQKVRDQLEPALDRAVREVNRLRATIERAKHAANEGWRALSDLAGESSRTTEWRGQTRQTSPF